VYGNASVCFGSWAFGCASHVPALPKQTPNGRRRIKRIHALMADEAVDLWAADEVHFQQHGSRCQMWIPPETKGPVLLHAPTRRNVGYFGVVRLRDGRSQYCRAADKFNGATFSTFVKSLRRASIRSGRRVVVITDNAKYDHARRHKQWREEHADDFALDYLPPYSPELNPIERVWKLTRRRCLHNRYFPKLDAVIAAVEAEFDQWTGRHETLRRLLLKSLCLASFPAIASRGATTSERCARDGCSVRTPLRLATELPSQRSGYGRITVTPAVFH